MVKYDDKTARGWPLPHRENRLYDDVERLREALNLVDEALTAIETHEGTIEDRQDSIDTRLDTILEGATEDTEILDARVDAEDKVHPNLGHNIRNLHRLILELGEILKYGYSEFEGLLRQFRLLSEAQIQGELNSREAHERRKHEIQQEALTRNDNDSLLQDEINSLTQTCLRNTLDLYDAIKRWRFAIQQETQARTENDAGLQSQINQNSQHIQQEKEKRTEADKQIEDEINAEIQERIAGDLESARQIVSNSEGVICNALSITEANERHRNALTREAQERTTRDEELHRQVNQVAKAEINNSLNLADEAQQRRMLREALDEEISTRSAHDAQHDEAITQNSRDIASNSEGVIRNALSIAEADERHRNALTREAQERTTRDEELHRQVNQVAKAGINNSLNLADEAQQRRMLREALDEEKISREIQIQNLREEIGLLYEIPLPGLYETLSGLQAQSDKNALAEMLNTLNLHEEAEQRRKIISLLLREIDNAIHGANENAALLHSDDSELQKQINQLAFAFIWLNVQSYETRRKVREIEITAESIPGRAATDEEFEEMLDRLYDKP